MHYEVIIEEFVLQVEVTHCVNEPGDQNFWDSDWDHFSERELEFKVISAITYDQHGIRMDAKESEYGPAVKHFSPQIKVSIWQQIDSNFKRR